MSDNPYPDGDGMKLNMGRNTMNYVLGVLAGWTGTGGGTH